MESPAPIPPARLVALQAELEPKVHLLKEDSYILGRFPSCQIIIPLPLVSRYHAKIERDGPRYLLSDMGSANGTFVNGRLIHSLHTLKDKDRIGLGSPKDLLCFLDPDPTLVPHSRLTYDKQRMVFLVQGQPLDLPKSQLQLLLHLYENIGSVCSRESCALALWGRAYNRDIDADALDKAVSSLRRQLREVAPEADLIETVRGIGYMLKL